MLLLLLREFPVQPGTTPSWLPLQPPPAPGCWNRQLDGRGPPAAASGRDVLLLRWDGVLDQCFTEGKFSTGTPHTHRDKIFLSLSLSRNT